LFNFLFQGRGRRWGSSGRSRRRGRLFLFQGRGRGRLFLFLFVVTGYINDHSIVINLPFHPDFVVYVVAVILSER
jgi:hypothetical protein